MSLARTIAGCGNCSGPLRQVRPAARLLCSPSPSSSRPSAFSLSSPHHSFHTSTSRPARRRPRFSSVSAKEMGLVNDEAIDRFATKHFPRYTTEEIELLAQKYTPGQLEALKAGEAAVDPRDLAVQGRLRTDGKTTGLQYVDDFATIDPTLDKRVRRHDASVPLKLDTKFMDDEQFADDISSWLASYIPKDVNLEGLSTSQALAEAAKHGPSDADILAFFHDRPALVDRYGRRVRVEETGDLQMAPSLGREIPGVTEHYRLPGTPSPEEVARIKKSRRNGREDEDEDKEDELDYSEADRLLTSRTGLLRSELEGMISRNMVLRFVSNQTRLGKVHSASVLSIAGNRDGRLGIGMAKSTEPMIAMARSRILAILNMVPIRRYEKRTIYGNVEGKFGGTIVKLGARPPGFGVRTPHLIFEMARAAGIHDLAASIPRSRNPMNVCKAAFYALTHQPDPEHIAIGRGKKLVDVRKVYYGGAVY